MINNLIDIFDNSLNDLLFLDQTGLLSYRLAVLLLSVNEWIKDQFLETLCSIHLIHLISDLIDIIFLLS